MTLEIRILLDILLFVGIVAIIRFYVILGQVRQSLTNLEETRTQVSSTMKRLETVATSTEEILRTEVAPTLQATRATLANLEITTKALADTTLAVRGLTGRAEQAVNAQRLLSAVFPLAKIASTRGGGVTSGLFAGITAGIKAVLNRKKRVVPKSPELEAKPKAPAITAINPILPPDPELDPRRGSRKQKQ